jgi:hypothetical protein
VPTKTCAPSRVPTLPHRLLSLGSRLPERTVSAVLHAFNVAPEFIWCSSKPNLPTPQEYEVPEVPNRELGPPPPGYGRYADASMDRPAVGQNNFSGAPAGGFIRRNLDDVTCFKVCLCRWENNSDLLLTFHCSAARKDTTQTNALTETFLGTVVAWTELDGVLVGTSENCCRINVYLVSSCTMCVLDERQPIQLLHRDIRPSKPCCGDSKGRGKA